MSGRFDPDPPPVEVRDVSQSPVPILRALEWIPLAFRAFRERPIPGSYGSEIRPTFDAFGTSRLNDVQFESFNGGVGNIEALLTQVPEGKYRHYLSLAFQHDDAAATHVLFPIIVVNENGTFPQTAIDDPARNGAAPNGEWFTVRNVVVPPEARIGAAVEAIGAGAQIFLRALWIEAFVGEPVTPY